MRAGDLFAWQVQTQLPAGSAVSYFLTGVVNNVPVRIAIPPVPADASGVASFSIASATTGTWTPARYQWVCFAFDLNGNRSELGIGKLIVDPDVGGATPADPRTQNEKLLANIKCLLQGKALDDVSMYKIGTRELTKMMLPELLKWEAYIEARVRRERIRRGEYVPTKTIGILFGGR